MTTHTFQFADGRSLTVKMAPGGERGKGWREWALDPESGVIGIDEDGFAVTNSDGLNFTLTDCCGATFKGCDGYTGCRACYAPAEGSGMAWGKVTPRVA